MTQQHRPYQPGRGTPSDQPDSVSRTWLASACRHTTACSLTAVAVLVSRTNIPTVGRAPRTAADSPSSSHVTRTSSTNVALDKRRTPREATPDR